jgi:hypothetical protein
MLKRLLRAPVAHFAIYFASAVSYIYLPTPSVPLRTDSGVTIPYGFDDATNVPGAASAPLLALLVALIPSIGALAGVALTQSAATPTWGRTVIFALLSLMPAAMAVALVLVREPTSATGRGWLSELALFTLVALWLLAPVVLTRLLYRSAST